MAGKLPTARRRVISASKRTDIPAFYMKWMLERVKAGWVDVPNPMFRHARDPLKRLSHVTLRPDDVIAIVWWSKNYAVYDRFHEAFSSYRTQFFHFTVNPRRADLAWIEPDVPPLEQALSQMRFLASLPGGPGMVAWRYDPIMFWREAGADRNSWDPEFFEMMCRSVAPLGISRCITSLADRYAKFERRISQSFPGIELRDPSEDEITDITGKMAQIANIYGVLLLSCTEPGLVCRAGFTRASCIDGGLLRGPTAPATDVKMRGREECGCTLHTDIGDYVTQECGYACIYCYANPNHRRFRPARVANKIPR